MSKRFHQNCEQFIDRQHLFHTHPMKERYFPFVNQKIISKSIFKLCDILMIVQKSYIIIHHECQLYFIDQHAASQKVIYMQEYMKFKRYKTSKLVQLNDKKKKIYHVPKLYKEILKKNMLIEIINNIGWYFNVIKQSGTFIDIQIVKQPYFHKTILNQNDFNYYLDQIYQLTETQTINQNNFNSGNLNKLKLNKQKRQLNFKSEQNQLFQFKPLNCIFPQFQLSQHQKQIIGQFACHKAIRFGDQISLTKATQIIRQLSEIQGSFNCPHSRILISYYGSAKQLGLIS